VYLLVGSHPHKRSNAAALMGIYCVLHLGWTPEQAYAPLRQLEPFTGFRDASCGVPTYQLPVHQVIAGMYRAKEVRTAAPRGWYVTHMGSGAWQRECCRQVRPGQPATAALVRWLYPQLLTQLLCPPSPAHLPPTSIPLTQVGFINWAKGESFDVEEYEHYEQVENGDLNWIVPGKFMAFSGPSSQPKHFGGWRTYSERCLPGVSSLLSRSFNQPPRSILQPPNAINNLCLTFLPPFLPLFLAVPEDYIAYFKEHNVNAVVRLNKRMYESERFTEAGVRHHEMYFPDGTCPSEQILLRFLDVAEREPGALAVSGSSRER
jgi:hypothetical protein